MEHSFETGYPEHDRDGVIFLQVCGVEEIFSKRAKNFFFDEETQVAVFRVDGALYAVSNICPHQHAPVICEGYVEDLTVTCPLHGWMYSLQTGKALGGGGKLKTYRVFEEGGQVYLEKPRPVEPNWKLW